jgi:hypothetical protein
LWRLQALFYEALRSAILGLNDLKALLSQTPEIRSLFRDSPRKRKRQAVEASSAARLLAKG